MAGFMERLKKWRDDGNQIFEEAQGFFEGGRARSNTAGAQLSGRRGRGRPPSSGTRTATAGATAAGKISLANLPAEIARRYPATGATANEVRAIMGWKATAPIGTVERLVKEGRLNKTGDRYLAPPGTQAAIPQAAAA